MKKKKSLMLIALLMMVGLTSGYVASTYAKYTSTVTGQGSLTVAKWAFDTDNASMDFDVDITSTVKANTLVNEKIAPGTEGAFNIALSNENTEVGVKYTISFTELESAPTNLIIKQGSNVVKAAGGTTASGTVEGYMAPGGSVTVPLTWEWAYETADIATNDPIDTTDGKAANTMNIKASIVGVQVDPTDQDLTPTTY